MRLIPFALLCGLALGCNESSVPTGVSSNPTTTRPAATPAERAENSADRTNTVVNARDRDGATKTPIDQDETKTAVRITAEIRKRVVDTKMSVAAQNVKIITHDGRVTLRGPVKSEDEKLAIEKMAKEVAGADNVDSELEVDAG